MPDVFTRERPTPAHTAPVLKAAPHKVGLFGSYCPHPTGVTFASQEPQEKILLFLRRHFVTNLTWVLTSIVLFGIPLFLPLLSFLLEDMFSAFSPQLIFVLSSVYYLVVISYILVNFISWFYNVGIVTNKRVVDIDATNILHHSVAATAAIDIIDAEYSQKGILQSIFDYGDVLIQTEGLKANFEFHATPRPGAVSDTILDVKEGQHAD